MYFKILSKVMPNKVAVWLEEIFFSKLKLTSVLKVVSRQSSFTYIDKMLLWKYKYYNLYKAEEKK